MNPILLSFLCGAAFIGGGAAMTILILTGRMMMNSKERTEFSDYWKTSLKQHAEQIVVLQTIAVSLQEIAVEAAKDE